MYEWFQPQPLPVGKPNTEAALHYLSTIVPVKETAAIMPYAWYTEKDARALNATEYARWLSIVAAEQLVTDKGEPGLVIKGLAYERDRVLAVYGGNTVLQLCGLELPSV